MSSRSVSPFGHRSFLRLLLNAIANEPSSTISSTCADEMQSLSPLHVLVSAAASFVALAICTRAPAGIAPGVASAALISASRRGSKYVKHSRISRHASVNCARLCLKWETGEVRDGGEGWR